MLAGYASPYLAFLKASHDEQKTPLADVRITHFWDNTRDELERYLLFNALDGQEATLHQLFLSTLPGQVEVCRQCLSVYKPPQYGSELFSQLKLLNLAQAQRNCGGRSGPGRT